MPFRRFRRKPRRKKSNRYAPRPVRLLVKKQPQSSQSRVLNFKRLFVQDLTLNTAAPPIGWTSLTSSGDEALTLAYVLSLDQLPNYTAFTQLFDSYRIKGFFRLEDGWNQVDVVNNKIDYKLSEAKGEESQIVIISKIGPQIIRNIVDNWNEIIGREMKLR